MRRAIQGAAFALVLLGGCAGLRDLVNPYPEAKFDCEESDCTRCVPIEGRPQPKGHLCSVTRDPNEPSHRISCASPDCVGDCQMSCAPIEQNVGGE